MTGSIIKNKYKNKNIAWIVLAIGLTLSAAATIYTKSSVDEIARQDFIIDSNEVRNVITNRLEEHARILQSGAALFNASDVVTRKEWHNFTQTHKVEKQLPGIQGIGFSLLIPRAELPQHIQGVQSEGFPEYNIRPEGDREVYSSIIYLEPFSDRNLRAFGYDMFQEPVRRKAMEQARDTDSAALSGKVVLVQETGKEVQAGTLMYVPVYRKGMPTDSVEGRRAAIYGWVYSPYRMNDLMQGILRGLSLHEGERIHLQVFDGTNTLHQNLLYEDHPAGDEKRRSEVRFIAQLPIDFNGHRWTLSIKQTGVGFMTEEYLKAWLVMFGGTLITLLLFILILALLSTRDEARRIAEKLTVGLRESQGQLNAMLTSVPDHMSMMDKDLNILWANDVAKRMFGEDLVGKKCYKAYHGRETPCEPSPCIVLKAFEDESMHMHETQVIDKDGKTHCFYCTASVALRDENANPSAVTEISRDITERKKAEDAVRVSESKYRNLVDTTGTGYLILDAQGRVLDANPEYVRLSGYGDLRDILGRSVIEWTTEEAKERNLEAVRQCMKDRRLKNFITEYVGGNGKITPVEISATVEGEGESLRIISLCRDITERKITDEALRMSEEKFKAIANYTVNWESWFAPDGKYLWVNPAVETFTGYSAPEILAMSDFISTVIAEEDRDIFAARMNEAIHGSKAESFEFRYLHKNGTKRWLSASWLPIFDTKNNFLGVRASGRDITDRKKVEDAIAAAKDYTENIIKSMFDTLIVINPDGKIRSINEATAVLLGYKEEELIGKPFGTIVAEEEEEEGGIPFIGTRLKELIKEGFIKEYDMTYKTKSGEMIPVSFSGAVMKDKDGELIGIVCIGRDLRERKKADEALRESEETLRVNIENSFDVIFTLNKDGVFSFVSPAWQRHFGYPPSDVIGKSFAPFVHPDDIAPLAEYLKRVLSIGKSETSPPYRVKHADGSWRLFICNGAPYADRKGDLRFSGVGRDITDAKKAEDELRESEDLLSKMTTRIPGVVYQFYARPSGEVGFHYISDRSEQTIGLKADLSGYLERFVALVLPEYREGFVKTIEKAVKEATEWKFEGILQKPTGEKIWFLGNSTPLQRENEIVFNGLITDITDRKKAEKVLAETEEKIHLLLNSTAEAIYGLDMNGNCTFCNKSCLDLLGYKHHDELLGKNMHWQIHAKHPDGTPFPVEECRIFKAFKKGEGTHVDDEVLWRADGTAFPAEYWSYPQRRDGVIVGAVVTFLDITERKKTEDALRESEEVYRTLFSESRDAMMIIIPGGKFISGNPEAIRMFGCRDEKEFTSKSPADLSPEYQPDGALSSDKAHNMMMLAIEKGSSFFEWTHKRMDGMEFPATVLLSSVEKGDKAYLQATVRDTTEIKRSEEALKETQAQLFQSDKMTSLGQLSAGACHEINNPLAGIVGFTEAMLKDLKNQKIAPDIIEHDLKIILKSAERCKVIVGNLLNFARAKDIQRQESDINSLIDDALALVEYKTKVQNINVVKKYEKNLLKVNIDVDQMMQVLINIISNAQTAMPDRGDLLVRTWSEENFVLIEIKDTGKGIEKDNLLKIFDPFFTTREPGQGVGLGLSICYSIMKRHEGSIEVKSEGKNKGASFIIRIPA